MNLGIDTVVRYPTGEQAGHITRVVVDPEHRQVVDVVLTTTGLFSRDVVVPLRLLDEAPGGVTELAGGPDLVDGLPDFEVAAYTSPPEDWSGPAGYLPGTIFFPEAYVPPAPTGPPVRQIPPGTLAIAEGTAVWCEDGRLGVVDEVVSGDDGALVAFIVRPDDAGVPDLLVPIDLVLEATETRIRLNCALDDVAGSVEPIIEEDKEAEPRDLL